MAHYSNEKILAPGTGLITNLQDFAVQDGPGLRVLAFLKGCPLRCTWCQNPENLAPYAEIEYRAASCVECGRCQQVCPVEGAIVDDKQERIDRAKCIRCMRCTEVCLGKALREVGEWVSAEALLDRVAAYKPFFDNSDRGGVTFSGGEPTFQPEFLLKSLKLCRQTGIHTVVQTCGYTTYELMKQIAEAASMLLYDIKHMDPLAHAAGTGKPNDLILSNLTRLCNEVDDTEYVVRLPLISGFNDDEENVRRTAEYLVALKKVERLDLLGFNELPAGKYRAMGMEWKYGGVKRQTDERLEALKAIVESYGLTCSLGGLW
ncbi:MAG: glycyl-radical enzyme activating protein [Chloroflexi bacterium]|nr:glycyl-radical enzyme activating protein [Chloroflexota bacterium]